MAINSSNTWLISIVFVVSCLFPVSYGRVDPNFRVKAVNLGGWLVTEGWIKPSLFDGIINKDFLVCKFQLFLIIIIISCSILVSNICSITFVYTEWN